MRRILVVSPHPDDAEIGMGGSMTQWARGGDDVTILQCTGQGDLLMQHSQQSVSFEERKSEQEAAAKILGVAVHYAMLGTASYFDTVPQAKFTSFFDRWFGSYDRVFIPMPSYNEDHNVVYRAAFAAFRPGKLPLTELFMYEQPVQAHTEYPFNDRGKWYNTLSSEQVDRKLAAIDCFPSQMKGREHTLFGKAGVQTLAVLRGMECGTMFAELFYPVKMVT